MTIRTLLYLRTVQLAKTHGKNEKDMLDKLFQYGKYGVAKIAK
jgi:hypothetical protein